MCNVVINKETCIGCGIFIRISATKKQYPEMKILNREGFLLYV
ncbi:MAG: hypothetical protein AB7V48_01945 [Sedimentibacter sp.]